MRLNFKAKPMKQDEAKMRALEILDGFLEQNKHRKTSERYAILDAVAAMRDNFTLEELGRKLMNDLRFPVSRGTLYNTLNLFVKLRIVMRHRILNVTSYEFCRNEGRSIKMVCSTCGKVSLMKSQVIDNTIDTLHMKRFKCDSYALYLYGICSTCQAKMTRTKKKDN